MITIKENVSLANYSTFRLGGPAKFFVEVKSEEELLEALKYVKNNNLKFFILGGGSNILVSDKGFDGLVIKISISHFSIINSSIEASAGVPLARVVNEATKNELTGMEWAAGIPGTVGGAVRGNAGAFGGCMGDVIKSVKILDTSVLMLPSKNPGENKEQNICPGFKVINKEDCLFNYRQSVFKQNLNLIILSAFVELKLGDINKIQNRVKEIITKRIANHPQGGSAGSYFINPVVKDEKMRAEFKKDTGKVPKDERLPAGWFIDQLNLRGKKIGRAMIAREHANWIVNTGGATAEDVIMLASIIKQQVRDRFGIELQEEVQYLGF